MYFFIVIIATGVLASNTYLATTFSPEILPKHGGGAYISVRSLCLLFVIDFDFADELLLRD